MKICIKLLVALLLLLSCSFIAVFHFLHSSVLNSNVLIDIPCSSSAHSVLKILDNHQVIRDKGLIMILLRVSGKDKDLKYGKYFFSAGVTQYEALKTILEGRSVNYKVTIPEGLTSYQVVNLLLSYDVFEYDFDATRDALGCLYMLPNTYYIPYNYKISEIVQLLCDAGDKVINDIWVDFQEQKSGHIRDISDLLTLASIVEKEAYNHDEMNRISGVFYNRLDRRMRLEADPTVIYAITNGTNLLDRPLSKKDLRMEHTHNTYYIYGLPPSPICHPSMAAIYAAMYPLKSEYLFFVSHKNQEHIFARTLKEHHRNVFGYEEIDDVTVKIKKK